MGKQSPFRVLVTANAFVESGEAAAAPLIAAGAEVVASPRPGPLPVAELLRCLEGCDAVIASSDPYSREVLAACPRLRLIARWGVGIDNIDLEAATELGVAVANAPGATTEAVADYTFAMMLALARHLVPARELMLAGGWGEFRGVGLALRCLGLIGFGAIGRAVARRAAGFDMTVLAFDPALSPEAIAAAGAEAVSLAELLARSDFVSLHAAVTPASAGMIDAAALRAMKPTAYLINAARGRLIDEAALLQALREEWIAGAAIDVYTREPLPADDPLRRLPNCLALPHNAFNTVETAAAVNQAVVASVLAVMRGDLPPGLANPEVGRAGVRVFGCSGVQEFGGAGSR
jgi:phosphoglycerate dehydrogenase-like enzyme